MKIIDQQQSDSEIEVRSKYPRILLYAITSVVFLFAIAVVGRTINVLTVQYYNLNLVDRYLDMVSIGLTVLIVIGCVGIFVRKTWGWFLVNVTLVIILLDLAVDFKRYLSSYQVGVIIPTIIAIVGVLAFYNTSPVVSWFGIQGKNFARLMILIVGIILIASTYFIPRRTTEVVSSIYLTYREDIAYLESSRYSGRLSDYYRNGQVSISGDYADGIKHGYWEEFFENGQLSSSYTYKNGKLSGKFLQNYPDGNVEREEYFVDDLKHGSEITFYNNNQKRSESHYREGVLDGDWMTWLESGLPDESGQYKNGEKEGVWKAWIEGVIFLEENFKDGKREGLAKYYENGVLQEEGNYQAGKKHGTWRQFDAEGSVISISEYFDGTLTKDVHN